jgi:hypothetical protein
MGPKRGLKRFHHPTPSLRAHPRKPARRGHGTRPKDTRRACAADASQVSMSCLRPPPPSLELVVYWPGRVGRGCAHTRQQHGHLKTLWSLCANGVSSGWPVEDARCFSWQWWPGPGPMMATATTEMETGTGGDACASIRCFYCKALCTFTSRRFNLGHGQPFPSRQRLTLTHNRHP